MQEISNEEDSSSKANNILTANRGKSRLSEKENIKRESMQSSFNELDISERGKVGSNEHSIHLASMVKRSVIKRTNIQPKNYVSQETTNKNTIFEFKKF